MCVAWSFIKMEIGKQWSRISIIRSYQLNVYPAGDKSYCWHQWPMEHVLCMYFGFCVCRCNTNCSILVAPLFLYFSHCPRSYRGTSISISCWQRPCPVLLATCRKWFTSWSNLKIFGHSYFSLLQIDYHLLAMNSSDIIQIRFLPFSYEITHHINLLYHDTLHSFIHSFIHSFRETTNSSVIPTVNHFISSLVNHITQSFSQVRWLFCEWISQCVCVCVCVCARERERVSFSHFYSAPIKVIQSVFCSDNNDRFSITYMRTFSTLSVTHTVYVRRWLR